MERQDSLASQPANPPLLTVPLLLRLRNSWLLLFLRSELRAYLPQIGDVDEGVVEGSEDTGNAKDELA